MTPPPDGAPRSFLSSFLAILAYGGLAAGLAAALASARIAQLELAFNARTFAIICVMAGGAGLAAVVMEVGRRLLLRRLPLALRLPLVAVGLTGLTMLASGAVFAVVLRDVIEGDVLNGDRPSLHGLIIPHASAAYLMFLAGWDLMFPWMLPLLAVSVAAAAEALDREPAEGER